MKTQLDVQVVLALDQLPSRLGDGGVLRVGDNALRVQELVVDGRVVYVLEVVASVGEVKLVNLSEVLAVLGVLVRDVSLVPESLLNRGVRLHDEVVGSPQGVHVLPVFCKLPVVRTGGNTVRVGDTVLCVKKVVVDGRVVYVLEVVVTGVGEVKLVHLADVLQVVGVDVADVNLVGVNGVVGLKNVQALEGNLQR